MRTLRSTCQGIPLFSSPRTPDVPRATMTKYVCRILHLLFCCAFHSNPSCTFQLDSSITPLSVNEARALFFSPLRSIVKTLAHLLSRNAPFQYRDEESDGECVWRMIVVLRTMKTISHNKRNIAET